MALKKTFKIIIGLLIFLTLPSLLFFGFVYFNYHEDLPQGETGEQANTLALSMLNSLDYEAYKNTAYIEWTFKSKRHYKWKKDQGTCSVFWKNIQVNLKLDNPTGSKVYIDNQEIDNEESKNLIKKAMAYFNNDSFWLVAPYEVMDFDVSRKVVTLENNQNALLVTYAPNSNNPDESFLWILDENYKPTKFKMWVDDLPIGGLEASWTDWTTTESGAQLPTFHEFLFFGIQLQDVKGTP
ncbi:hypothetical protein C1T31_10695 [Hanstruepera neustonica]|uniref:Uncharacterized protein n=1 Tax=Hanstruepera neustonica TaxID=1445657 RepID=A0A2K1DX56_9FLAO|nr:hypothetical protein [Hanstruepera neustonica]PNQ72611.1 hypothetical protein C1T31_10695 [Hanstruepera neustonica]